jgi:hypothetical protein
MNRYDELIQRLEREIEDAEYSLTADVLSDAIEMIEEMRDQRVGWKCVVGGETFTTHDESVANDWIEDEFEVEKFFM